MRVLAWPAFRKEAANPHAALLARELLEQGVDIEDWRPLRALIRPGDLWHLHHPETVLFRRWAPAAWAETLAFLLIWWLARLRGTRMLWTIHDLGSNDRLHPRLERMFWNAFVPRVDGVICLTEGGRRDALERFPELGGRPSAVIPHGHYLDAYPSGIGRAAARAQLGLDPEAPVVLHFGLIRPYKNVPHLISVFRQAAIPGAVLVIGGRPFDEDIEREVRAAAEGATGVRLDLRFIGADEVQAYFEAADLVVLPYSHVTNSGAIFLALSFGRPVLVPDLGAMGEHARDFGADWVALYDGALDGDDLAAAVRWSREVARAPIDMSPLAWGEIARQTKAFYRTLAQDRSGNGVVPDEDRR